MADPQKVAVVNHDAVFLRLMDRLLQVAGYKVILCPSGMAAHDVIAKEQPDLVMIDTWLEAPDAGWQLLQTLQLDPQTLGIPVLVSTSDPDAMKAREQALSGMPNVHTLAKPFAPDTLTEKIKTILRDGHRPA